jgi:uncharacterized protein
LFGALETLRSSVYIGPAPIPRAQTGQLIGKTMNNFTPIAALMGGLLIGISSSLLLWLNGKIAGISGIANGALWAKTSDERAWRILFVVGLIIGGFIYVALFPGTVHARSGFPLFLVGAAGLLVGFGTALGSGCTSGHGVCGLGRLSVRSLVATMTFLVAAVITVFVMRHVLGVNL